MQNSGCNLNRTQNIESTSTGTQRVIVPKGLVRPDEAAVIEIPLAYRNSPTVIAKPIQNSSSSEANKSRSKPRVKKRVVRKTTTTTVLDDGSEYPSELTSELYPNDTCAVPKAATLPAYQERNYPHMHSDAISYGGYPQDYEATTFRWQKSHARNRSAPAGRAAAQCNISKTTSFPRYRDRNYQHLDSYEAASYGGHPQDYEQSVDKFPWQSSYAALKSPVLAGNRAMAGNVCDAEQFGVEDTPGMVSQEFRRSRIPAASTPGWKSFDTSGESIYPRSRGNTCTGISGISSLDPSGSFLQQSSLLDKSGRGNQTFAQSGNMDQSDQKKTKTFIEKTVTTTYEGGNNESSVTSMESHMTEVYDTSEADDNIGYDTVPGENLSESIPCSPVYSGEQTLLSRSVLEQAGKSNRSWFNPPFHSSRAGDQIADVSGPVLNASYVDPYATPVNQCAGGINCCPCVQAGAFDQFSYGSREFTPSGYYIETHPTIGISLDTYNEDRMISCYNALANLSETPTPPPNLTYNAGNRTYNAPNGTYNAGNRTYNAPNATYNAGNRTFNAPNGTFNVNRTCNAPNSTFNAGNTTYARPNANSTFNAGNRTVNAGNRTFDVPKPACCGGNSTFTAPNVTFNAGNTTFTGPAVPPPLQTPPRRGRVMDFANAVFTVSPFTDSDNSDGSGNLLANLDQTEAQEREKLDNDLRNLQSCRRKLILDASAISSSAT